MIYLEGFYDRIRYIDIISKSGHIQLLIDKYDDEWWSVTRFVQSLGYYYSIDSNGLIELKDTFFWRKGRDNISPTVI